jgi:phospholipid/cholesterol/gamma-HCH transport system substrate-binding protein
VRLGQVDLISNSGYALRADFPTAGGLQTGAVVELAGVKIGQVEKVTLADYHAQVKLRIHQDISLQEDAKAAIKTKGLIGERYVEIVPGKAPKRLEAGSQIHDTVPPVDINEIISQFIFGSVGQKPSGSEAEAP